MIIEIEKTNIPISLSGLLTSDEIRRELNINPFGKYLILMEENKVIGYLYYSDIYERVEINQLEIEKIHRNCGKASELLKRLIVTVDKSITLEVKCDNEVAIHLYEKFGFQKKAIRRGYYQGIDGILMERN